MAKSTNEIAFEVIFGKWGRGKARKKKLEKAGYDYDKVQKRVNTLLTRRSVNTIANEVIAGKWGSGEVRKKRLKKCGYNYITVQKKVNEILEKKKTIVDKEIDACIAQAKWATDFVYGWTPHPTIENSKKKSSCVSYGAVVYQRIGVLEPGEFVWIDDNKKVFGTNNKMDVIYMSGTLKSNRDKLKRGDMVIGGNGKTGAGEGSHEFILSGKWDKDGNPYIYDQESGHRVRDGKTPEHTWTGNFPTIAAIRLK